MQRMAYGCVIALPMHQAGILMAEPDMWQQLSPHLGAQGCIDLGLPKASGEWLLSGASHAPQQQALSSWDCEVVIGSSQKTLRIHGPRTYAEDRLTPGRPVKQVDVSWSSAWGGIDIAENRQGCGARQENGEVVVPSVEYPQHAWRNPDEKSKPAGVLPLDTQHPIRQQHIGTYGADYVQRYYPGYPSDFNRHYFNLASEDQRISGYWAGNEKYQLLHWHPEFDLIEGQLPGLRCALWCAKSDAAFEAVAMNLTTVWFFPRAMALVLVFHGSVPIDSLNGQEIERVITGLESMSSPAWDRDHYETIWQQRTGRDSSSALASLDDQTLIPTGWKVKFEALEKGMQTQSNPALKNHQQNMVSHWTHELEKINQQQADLQAQGLPSSPPLKALEADMRAQIALIEKNSISDGVNNDVASMSKKYQELLNGQNKPWKDMLDRFAKHDSLAKQPGEWDMASKSEATLSGFQHTGIANTEIHSIRTQMNGLNKLLQESNEPMDQAAHQNAVQHFERLQKTIDGFANEHQPDGAKVISAQMNAYASLAPSLPFNNQTPTPQDIEAWQASQKMPSFKPLEAPFHLASPELWTTFASLKNLTGFKLDLRQRDLSQANWHDMTLIDCDFSEAVFSNSTLENCHFINCDFSNAQWHHLKLKKIRFTACRLQHVNAAESQWSDSQLMNCELDTSDFTRSNWKSTVVIKGSCRDSTWGHSQLQQLIVNEVEFGASDFSQSTIMQSAWIQCLLTDTNWNYSSIQRSSMEKSQMPQQWLGVKMSLMSLRGAQLKDSRWTGALLDGVDLNESDLTGAYFNGSHLNQVQAVNSNLSRVNFQEAKLTQCMFMHANLEATSFEKALLDSCWLGQTNSHLALHLDLATTPGSTFHPQAEYDAH